MTHNVFSGTLNRHRHSSSCRSLPVIVVGGLTNSSYKNNGVYKGVFRGWTVGHGHAPCPQPPQSQNETNIFGGKLDILVDNS